MPKKSANVRKRSAKASPKKRKTSPWSRFLKKHGGQGLTQKEMKSLYNKLKSRKSSPKASPKKRASPKRASPKRASPKRASPKRGRCKSKVRKSLKLDDFYCLPCCAVHKSVSGIELTESQNRGRIVNIIKGQCPKGHKMTKIIKASDVDKVWGGDF